MSGHMNLTANHSRLLRLIYAVGVISVSQAAYYTGLSERKIGELFKRWHGQREIIFDRKSQIAAISESVMDQFLEHYNTVHALWVYLAWMKRKGCGGIYRSTKPFVCYYFDDSDGVFYEVVSIPSGKEFLAGSYMSVWKDERQDSETSCRKRIAVIEKVSQLIELKGLADLYCMISPEGQVRFIKEEVADV